MDFIKEFSVVLIALIGIWLGSGLIINSVEKISTRLHASPFVISFFLLGIMTSLTEVSVAVNSFIKDEIEVSVGNLLGGMIVLFLLVIPLLGALGGEIKLNHDLNKKNLLLCLMLIVTPAILIADRHVTPVEGLGLLAFYCTVAYILYRSETPVEKVKKMFSHKPKLHSLTDGLAILAGGAMLIFASNLLVRQTIDFATDIGISPFILSLLAISIGTNLPEITLAIRSVLKGKRDVAFGNYVGSAAFSTVIFGTLAIAKGGFVIQADFIKVFAFLVMGLVIFYFFSQSNNGLSRKESFALLALYCCFIATEIALL